MQSKRRKVMRRTYLRSTVARIKKWSKKKRKGAKQFFAPKFHQAKRFKQIWARFKGLIWVYIGLWVVWAWIYWRGHSFLSVLSFFGITYDDAFFRSWFPSFTEDLIFFGTGFLGLVLSTKLLKDEAFNVRLSSLANGINVSQISNDQLEKEIIKLLSYNKDYKVDFRLDHLDPEQKHVFVFIKMRATVVNMCQEDDIPLQVASYVETGPQIGEHGYGFITKYSVEAKAPRNIRKELPDRQEFIDGDIHHLTKKGWSKTIEYPIPGNCMAEWTLCFSLWIPLGADIEDKDNNWFTAIIVKFTENYTFTVENRLDLDVFYKNTYCERLPFVVGSPPMREDYGSLSAKSAKRMTNELIFHKNDKFSIFFSLQDVKEIEGKTKKQTEKNMEERPNHSPAI